MIDHSPSLSRLFFIACALAPCRGALLQAQAGPLPLPLAKIDSIATRFLHDKSVPGLAVALVTDGRVQAERVYGVSDVRSGKPLVAGTVFQVGSVTKVFTATLIGTLVAEGKVDTASPVSRYLPHLAPAIGAIRISELLRQTGGLADAAGGDGEHRSLRLTETAAGWGDSLVILPAGAAFSYSNLGYTLLGAVAEQVTGRSYTELLQARVLRPMGITPAVMGSSFAPSLRRAIGHRAAPTGRMTAVDPPSDDTRLWPAGYLAATPSGVGRMLAALMSDGRLDGRQVVPRGWMRAITTSQVPVPGLPAGAGYGAGVFIDTLWGAPSIWHPGLIDGSTALFVGTPRAGIGVVILANRDGVRLEGLARDILRQVMESRGRPVPAASPFAPPVTIPHAADELAPLAGMYVGRFTIRVYADTTGLMLERFGTRVPLRDLGHGRWLVGDATPDRQEVVVLHPELPGVRPAFLQMGLWSFVRR